MNDGSRYGERPLGFTFTADHEAQADRKAHATGCVVMLAVLALGIMCGSGGLTVLIWLFS